MTPALNFEAIYAKYSDSTSWIIDNLFLESNAQKIIGIIGKNGSGKSTLAHCLLGIIPHITPGVCHGSALLNSENLLSQSIDYRLNLAGYSFQDTESQILFGTVADVLGFHQKDINKTYILKILDLLNCRNLVSRSAEELSGGEAQCIALASALINEPLLVIYDEATTALDPSTKIRFMHLVQYLKEKGCIVLLLGQRAEVLSKYCDEMYYLENGCLSKSEVLSKDSLLRSEIFWEKINREIEYEMNSPPTITMSDVYFVRKGGSHFSLGPTNFKVFSGETIALIGPNGSGKSTLFYLLFGMLKAKKGNFFLDGVLGSPKKSEKWISSMNMVTQSPTSQFIGGTVFEELTNSLSHLSEKQSCRIWDIIQADFSFLRKEMDPLELSYGQQRMLNILLAIIGKHDILLIDEPEQGLDSSTLQYITRWLQLNQKKRRKTVIYSTHDLEFAKQCSDRIIIINKGKIVSETVSKDIIDIEKWYFANIIKPNNE